jgi:hypothetical protein
MNQEEFRNKNPLCSAPKHKTEGMPALESSSGSRVFTPTT